MGRRLRGRVEYERRERSVLFWGGSGRGVGLWEVEEREEDREVREVSSLP